MIRLPRPILEWMVNRNWTLPIPIAYNKGFQYLYKGDTVFRAHGQWVSLGFESSFATLKDLDAKWDEYFAACQETMQSYFED